MNEQYLINQKTIKDYEKLEQDVFTNNIDAMDKSLKKFYDDSETAYDTAFSKLKKVSDETKKYCELNLNNMKFSIGINADTSNAKKQLNAFGSELNRSGLGINFTPFSLKANGGVYSNGSWKDIPQYANGGAPSHGTMFWAGERGPEIVAHANGKTEVLNQSQIASAIYSAVYSAMSQFGGQSSEIDVHIHTDEGSVIDRIEQRTKQTGQFPFTIPTY